MLFEDLLDQTLDIFTSGPVDTDWNNSFIGSVHTLLSYIDYLDPIVPVSLLLSCCGIILGWTLICIIIRLVVDFCT